MSEKILVVDNDERALQTFARNLASEGYTVLTASEGQQALHTYEREWPDIALVDVHMPHMDGFAVLQAILKCNPEAEVILITNHGDWNTAIAALRAGASDFIPKPVEQEVLNAALQRVQERLRLKQELRQRNRDLALLTQVGQELAATLDLQQVIEQSLKAVTETIGAEGASIWLWDEEQAGWLTCRAVFRHDQNRSLINLRLRPGQGIAGWVAQKGQSLIVPRTSKDSRFYPKVDAQTGFRTLSLLTVPLRVHDEVIGVLQVVNKLAAGFDENDRTLVETLAASAAIAIENARLVESLRQRTVELQASNEELDAFAHTVAHGLKNPLGRVIGFAQALEEDYASLPDEELRRFLHIIAQSGYKMNRIIDALLLLAGLREMEVEMEPLDMAGIVAEVQQQLAHMIQEYQADIVLPDAWPVALGYGPWVEEVWANYISNALKYGGQPPRIELGFGPYALSHENGVNISGHEFEPETRSDSKATTPRAKQEMVRFWIKDNGTGITPQDQTRLFTPFTRIDQISTHGHGVGLSIVQRIVDKLGGQVGVESEIGVGSVFWFTLPQVVSDRG